MPCSAPTCVCSVPDCSAAIATTYRCDGKGGCAHVPTQCAPAGCNEAGTLCACPSEASDAASCSAARSAAGGTEGGAEGGAPGIGGGTYARDDAAAPAAQSAHPDGSTSEEESETPSTSTPDPTTDASKGVLTDPPIAPDAQVASPGDSATARDATPSDAPSHAVPICSDDGTAAVDSYGSHPCTPYACRGGICLTACEQGSDCSGSHVCDSVRHTCVPFAPGAPPPACMASPGSDARSFAAVLFALALLGCERRRARPRSS